MTATPFAPSEGLILFDRSTNQADSIFALGAGETGQHLLVSGRLPGFHLAPDGSRIVIGALDRHNVEHLATVRPDGSGDEVLPGADTTLNEDPDGWSPDGTRILFHGWRGPHHADDGVYTERASDGGDLVRVTTAPPGQQDTPIAYSPDGTRILFWRMTGQVESGGTTFDAGNIDVVGVDGKGLVRLNPPGTVAAPIPDSGFPEASWSPDGEHVALNAGMPESDGWHRAIFVAHPDGTNVRRITPWMFAPYTANWSPDGRWIGFNAFQGGSQTLFVVHPDGSGLRELTHPDGANHSELAAWSPDSTQLLFRRGVDDPVTDLWIINVDGTGLTQVTHDVGWYIGYSWGPSAQ